ncbi:MAG: hypothetical protein AAF645_14010, partial [Myxococcota bacterium]
RRDDDRNHQDGPVLRDCVRAANRLGFGIIKHLMVPAQPVLSGGCSTGAAKPSSLLGFLVPTLLLLLGTRRRPAG